MVSDTSRNGGDNMIATNRRRTMGKVESMPADVIMTTETNPAVLAICYAQGWCANPNYMTKSEAEAVTSVGTVFRNNTDITHFDEFEYFTGVTSLASYAFVCKNLTTIKIPDSVTTIGSRAFNVQGGNLRYVTIGRGVTSIGSMAFSIHIHLQKVTFNGSISAARNITNAYLQYTREYDSDVYTVIDGVLYNGTELIAYPGQNGITSFTVPSFVTKIGNYTFNTNQWLKNIVINEGCTVLGDYAFQNSKLQTIDLPSTLTTIAQRCIYQINPLYSITSRAMTAPSASATYALEDLGSSASQAKVIYVPSGATGYDAGKWATLVSSGWTLNTIS